MTNRIFAMLLTFLMCQTLWSQERIQMRHNIADGCFPGDTIHVELKLTSASDSAKSGIVYVDLLMPNGEMIDKKSLYINNSMAACDMRIDSILPSGFYELRAYTRIMTLEQYNLTLSDEHRHDVIYATQVIPVYSLADRNAKGNVRHIDMQSYKDRDNCVSPYAYNWRRTTPHSQCRETAPTFLGRLLPRSKDVMKNVIAADEMENRRLNLVIANDSSVNTAEVVTGKGGVFMCTLPGARGDYKIHITPAKGENLSKYYIGSDGLFSPLPRVYNDDELFDSPYKLKDDKSRKKHETAFFDVESRMEREKSKGIVGRDFFDWLHAVDRRFRSTNKVLFSPRVLNSYRKKDYNISFDINLLHGIANDSTTVCMDGITYKGGDGGEFGYSREVRVDSEGEVTLYYFYQPVVWIVDGKYRLITGLKDKITDFKVLRPSKANIPMYADEVKSVFITENPNAYKDYVRCSVLDSSKPVTVFITTQKQMLVDDSALYAGKISAPCNSPLQSNAKP